MKKALRLRFAALAAFTIAFAQIAVAAQPWPVDAAARHQAHASASANANASDQCTRHHTDGSLPTSPSPSPNLCEVHCQDAAQPDAVGVAIAAPIPQSWFPLIVAAPADQRGGLDVAFAPKCASPPARVLFSRFLN